MDSFFKGNSQRIELEIENKPKCLIINPAFASLLLSSEPSPNRSKDLKFGSTLLEPQTFKSGWCSGKLTGVDCLKKDLSVKVYKCQIVPLNLDIFLLEQPL